MTVKAQFLAVGAIIAVAAAAALGVRAFAGGAHAAGSAGFADTSGHPHELAVNIAADRGLFQGYRDGSFRPDRVMTETEAGVAVERLLDRYTDDAGDFVLTRAQVAVLLTRGVCGWDTDGCAPAPPLDRRGRAPAAR